MRSKEEIRERLKDIRKQLKDNYSNNGLGVFIENKLVNQEKILKWVLEDTECQTN